MKSSASILVLALIVGGAGYALSRGVYVGSDIVQFDGTGGRYYGRDCRYLFPSGVNVARKGGWNTKAEAENEFCTLFRL